MAKVIVKEGGKEYQIDLDGKYTEQEQEILERLGIIEKPKKKKYKNVKQEKAEEPVIDKPEEDGEA